MAPPCTCGLLDQPIGGVERKDGKSSGQRSSFTSWGPSMVVCPFVAAPEAEHLGSHPFVSMGAVVSQSPSWGIILHGNLRSALTEKKE